MWSKNDSAFADSVPFDRLSPLRPKCVFQSRRQFFTAASEICRPSSDIRKLTHSQQARPAKSCFSALHRLLMASLSWPAAPVISSRGCKSFRPLIRAKREPRLDFIMPPKPPLFFLTVQPESVSCTDIVVKQTGRRGCLHTV